MYAYGKLSDACLCAVVYIAWQFECVMDVFFWLLHTVLFNLNIMQLATLFMMYKHEDLKSMMIATLEVKERSDCYSLLHCYE